MTPWRWGVLAGMCVVLSSQAILNGHIWQSVILVVAGLSTIPLQYRCHA